MKNVCVLLIAASLFFISCTNAGASKLSYTDVETIRDSVKDREAQVSWTKELEGSRLNESLNPQEGLYSEDIKYSRLIAKVNKANQAAVFPEYPDLGLLDISALNSSAKETIYKFCQALSTDIYTEAQNYFDSSYIFNFVFFRNDFIEGWENNFNESFPVQKEDKSKKKSDEDDSQADKISLFSKWILAEPFVGEEITQVPVRFYCKAGTLDVTLYLNKKNLIYQIVIDRWGSL
ncbi:MAG: hypothetical protein K5681_07535 [Treponema sp.]|nr:hypothetical protein [Treponema sp.]